MTERGFEKLAEKLGHSFRRFDGDVAGKSVGNDDVDGAGRDIVPFDEPVEMDRGDSLADSSARAAYGVVSLQILRADVEQPDRRLHQTKNSSSEDVTHQGELNQVLLVAFNIGAEVQHHAFAPPGRKKRRDRRPIDAR